MIRTSRCALVAAGLTGVVLLSGCGQVRAGAAAIVGDDRISTDRLAVLVDTGLADPKAAQQLGTDRVAYQRSVLTRLVNADLLAAAAAQAGVSVPEGQVDARLAQLQSQAGGASSLEQQAAQSGIAPGALRPAVHDVVLAEALEDKLTADIPVSDSDLAAAYQRNIAQYQRVDTAHILVQSEKLARQLLAEVKADPSRFAALAMQYSIDTGSKAKGGELGFAGRGELVKEYEDAAFAAPDGTFTLAHSQYGWHVIKVNAHQITTLEQAKPELRRTVLSDQRNSRLQQVLTQTAAHLGVRVNPRFGSWDVSKLAVTMIGQRPGSVTSPAPGSSPEASAEPLAQ